MAESCRRLQSRLVIVAECQGLGLWLELLLQAPRVGSHAAASVLASLAASTYLDTSAQAELLGGLKALAEAGAHATHASFAGLIASSCGGLRIPYQLLFDRLICIHHPFGRTIVTIL